MVLLLNPDGKRADLDVGGFLDSLLAAGFAVVTADLCGTASCFVHGSSLCVAGLGEVGSKIVDLPSFSFDPCPLTVPPFEKEQPNVRLVSRLNACCHRITCDAGALVGLPWCEHDPGLFGCTRGAARQKHRRRSWCAVIVCTHSDCDAAGDIIRLVHFIESQAGLDAKTIHAVAFTHLAPALLHANAAAMMYCVCCSFLFVTH